MSPGSNENLKNLKPEARENAGDQVASGVGSKSDLPRKWREFSKPITHRVRRKTIATLIYTFDISIKNFSSDSPAIVRSTKELIVSTHFQAETS